MKKYPLINILILNWNGKKVLNDCLKSILTSSYKNYKITVIDNGSSDDSSSSSKLLVIYFIIFEGIS